MRILIADDHPIVRHGLKQMLASDPAATVVGEATNGDEALELARKVEWDMAIFDFTMPGRSGLYIAIVWTLLSLAVATLLGRWGFGAAVIGLLLAWAYSAPPLRLKRNGWLGNAACAACYESLPWFTGAALMTGVFPDWRIVLVAALYGGGAHGIMTLNDFKSIEGDRTMGVDSLPVLLGVDGSARAACLIMLLPQFFVVVALLAWDRPAHATAVALLVLVQVRMMLRFVRDPRAHALWYSGFGVPVYVSGMMVAAFALRGLVMP